MPLAPDTSPVWRASRTMAIARRLLRGEREQYQDVNPQPGHAMPIPRCYVDKDAPRLNRTMQRGRNICNQESEHSTCQMKPVHCGEDINKGTAGAAGQMKPSLGQLSPDKKLSGEKRHAK